MIKHKFALSAGFALLLVGLTVPGCKPERPRPEAPHPEVSARVLGETGLEVLVAVPPGHHAYLDRGDMESLIPISFDWAPTGASPTLSASPAGERDETVGATVLRGAGRFVFESAASETLRGKSVRVQSQICNEEKGVCYRPTIQEIELL
jgi:Disulphide bond corrector protein DsbC